MLNKYKAELEKWDGSHESYDLSVRDAKDLEEVIRAISADKSAMLSIETASESAKLIINANSGKFALSALLGQDDFYDLIGDANATGKAPFMIAGEFINFPLKFVVTADQALAAAVEFFNNNTLDISKNYRKQEDFAEWSQ